MTTTQTLLFSIAVGIASIPVSGCAAYYGRPKPRGSNPLARWGLNTIAFLFWATAVAAAAYSAIA